MGLKVDIIYTPLVNFAMQQNHAPVVREVRVLNDGDAPVCDIAIHITFEPAFAQEYITHIERIDPGCEETLGTVPISFSTVFLSNLTERVLGSMKVELSSEEETLFEQSYEISVLTFNEWGGVNILPEMLAAFSTPNHPEVTRIIKKASEILGRWTGSPSLDEYQTRDPDRVKKQMAALYNAIASEGITYATVPASFETAGQRIRLVDEVIGGKLGTCLDMSMLYVSCLEAMGLHPVVVITKGHAFAGCWLVMDSFADSVNDDPSLLTKRIAEGINEMLVVETTCMNAGSLASFDDACLSANQELVSGKFVLFVDIYRARIGQVRPLPMRVPGEGGWTLIADEATERKYEAPEDLSATDIIIDKKAVVDKKIIWERKLLDLSLRNNLLNTRITQDTIPIISVHIDELEDALAANNDFQILGKPADWDNAQISAGIYKAVNATDPVYDLVKMELSQHRLRTYLDDDKVKRALTHLYRSSRTAMEENGANTLYLALGMLKWYETPSSTKPRYAPILLLPVEIIRKSAASGYVIRSRDEETMLNITLLELLRQAFDITIGGLNPLPTDESGVDVSLIFNTIRRKIMGQKGWDVIEQAILGNFSFSKFIMWNDIHNNTDILLQSKIVASLMTGVVDQSVNQEIGEEGDLDERFAAGDIELPISADSSQLEAIDAALGGKSFILHGPPGTGKSQTITNIIANALYRGKRVLFVAEKMAALEVVQNRLESIGLGAFCLELHSNKAKKSSVLEQLKRTSEVAKRKSSEEYAAEAQEINEVRKEMNAHVRSIHKQYPLGVSLYDCIARYYSIREDCPAFDLPVQIAGKLKADQVRSAEIALSEYKAACAVVGNPAESDLLGIEGTVYDQEAIDAFERLRPLAADATALAGEAKQLRDSLLGGSGSPLSEKEYQALSNLASLMESLDRSVCPLLEAGDEGVLSDIEEACSHGIARDGIRKKILAEYDDGILGLNTAAYDTEWRSALAKGFLSRHFAVNKVLKKIQTYSNTGRKPLKDEIIPLLKSIAEYKRENDTVERLSPGAVAGVIRTYGEDWEKIGTVKESVRLVNSLLASLPVGKEAKSVARKNIAGAVSGGFKTDFPARLSKVMDGKVSLEDKLGAVFGDDGSDWAKSVSAHCERWSRGRDQLRGWIMYNHKRKAVMDTGVGSLIDQVENATIPLDSIADSFHKGLYKAYAEYILTQDQGLNLFHGTVFEEKISRFRGLCKDFETLTRDEVFARLASNLPALQKEASQNSEVGILQRNIRNGCRGVSLRKFFDLIPNLLPRMCPCMLMSPISVAQYIDPKAPKFDLVIFDEASQMPTCEAVGAIARGNCIIVVGDPKQMPPTNFFSTNTFDEDNPNMEDLESILDDCLALSFPSKYLRWHYRSKHESLIAFSNAKYYDNKLLTFPSPDDIKTKLQYQHVKGVYDRGGSRQNRAEAEAIVEEIRRRLEDPTRSQRSIGVVTFNSNQQSLIEDLLTDLFALRPDLEKIAMFSEEPIFVKNLENVQGDERDVILFSVGYGQDKDGKVALNFGPLNREGGWRRLNVAVSRARYEMKVFSTLTSDQIDLKRTEALGVAGLKAFLEYAEKGRSALRYSSAESAVADDGFVEIVAGELRKKGYDVRTNVGCSGYRIDIGVINPGKDSDYVLGILCDGYNYSASKSSRDREIVQIGILRKLGWKIVRLWAMDWWTDKDATLNALASKIDRALAGELEEVEEEALRLFDGIGSTRAVKGSHPDQTGDGSMNDLIPPEEIVFEEEKDEYSEPSNVIPYHACQLEQYYYISPEEFILGMYDSVVEGHIRHVIEEESPINHDLLCRRVLRACGISRVGSRVGAHIGMLIQDMGIKTTQDTFITYWKKDHDPETYPYIRHSNERDATDIPTRESLNAALMVLDEQLSLPQESLVREMAKVFGYSRVGDNVNFSMYNGIQYGKKLGLIEEVDGKVRRTHK